MNFEIVPGRAPTIIGPVSARELAAVAVSHLGRTHLFIEPFVIATERQLGENHPLRLLLRPHFEGTLAKVAAIGYRDVEFAGYPNVQAWIGRVEHALKIPA